MIGVESSIKRALREKMAEESHQLAIDDDCPDHTPEFKRIMLILDAIINDRTVPKNIKSVIQNSKSMLTSKEGNAELKISSMINDLDSVINDPNMPLYTRTQIWNLVSLLEEERNKGQKNR